MTAIFCPSRAIKSARRPSRRIENGIVPVRATVVGSVANVRTPFADIVLTRERESLAVKRRHISTRCKVVAAANSTAAAVVTNHAYYGQSLLRLVAGASLKEAFQSLSIMEAALDTVMILCLTYITVVFGKKIAEWASTALEKLLTKSTDDDLGHRFESVALALLDSIKQPSRMLIPVYSISLGISVLFTFAQVALEKVNFVEDPLRRRMCDNVAGLLSKTCEGLWDASEIVIIVFIGWSIINLKQKLVNSILEASETINLDNNEVSRFMQPISQLLTWAIVLAVSLSVLMTVGIDVGPMLTVGSVSTIAIGFAAQSTVGNLVSALSLYTSRTFIAGDRVEFKSLGGSTVVAGTVQEIKPMRTLVKCDNGSLVYVNNKDLATSLMVVNESELSKHRLSSSIAAIYEVVTVRYKDIDKIGGIVKEIDQYLRHHPDLDTNLSRRCALIRLTLDGCQLEVKGTLSRNALSRRGQVYTELFLTIERIIRKNGAYLSTSLGMELPEPLV